MRAAISGRTEASGVGKFSGRKGSGRQRSAPPLSPDPNDHG